jgi:hypothetical protein
MLEKHPLGQAVEVELELHHPDRTTGALVGDRKAYGSAIGINSTKMKQHPSRLSTAICGTTETPVLAAAMRVSCCFAPASRRARWRFSRLKRTRCAPFENTIGCRRRIREPDRSGRRLRDFDLFNGVRSHLRFADLGRRLG